MAPTSCFATSTLCLLTPTSVLRKSLRRVECWDAWLGCLSSAFRQYPFLTISLLLATVRMDIPVSQAGVTSLLERLSASMVTWKLFLVQLWTGRLRFGELTISLKLSNKTSSSRCYSEISPPCERKNRRSAQRTSFVGVDLTLALPPCPRDWTISN